jgi:formylglycine-generating enzyme required for sulfatase activity
MQFVSHILSVRLSSLTVQPGKPDGRVRFHPLTTLIPHHGLVLVMEIILMASCLGVAAESASQPKAPVPDEAVEQAAKKTAGEIYGGRFALAQTAADKTALAAEMIAGALKVRDGSPDQFVLLKIARDIAARAGDATTALSAVKELVQRFDVSPVTLSAETLLTSAEQANMTAQRKAVAEAAGGIISQLAAADEYELAIRVCEAGRLAAQGAREFKLAGDFSSQLPELRRWQTEFQAYRDALAVMEASPTEPAANLAAGRYLCLVKGDWERGIPMLALGSDAALKAAALLDLRGAASAEAQAAIGDAWWDVAETNEGTDRDLLRLRAGVWYRQAEPKLAGGLSGLKAKQRLEEISKLGRNTPAASRRSAPSQPPPPAIAPFDEKAAKQHQAAWAKYLGVPVQYTNSIGMRFMLIPPGEFEMGSTAEQVNRLIEEAKKERRSERVLDRIRSETPRHCVRVSRPFYTGIYEVTQAEYELVMKKNPSKSSGNPLRPVEQVTWHDAVDFCRRLGELPRETTTGAAYRLLSEAEWEYCCRAGTTTHYSFGDDVAFFGYHGWWSGNSGGGPQPVGRLRPNSFGLFDMHGNVWEWCADWHANGYYTKSPAEDPKRPDSGSSRVLRGGSWGDDRHESFRCAYRYWIPPVEQYFDRGFRVALTLAP